MRSLPDGAPAARSLRVISTQIDRIARIVCDMLDFARMREPRLTRTGVAPVLGKVLDFMSHRFEEGRVRLDTDLSDAPATVTADPDQLHQVFLNLCTNALDAMPDGGTLRVAASRMEKQPPEKNSGTRRCVAVTFEDTGIGIAPENLDHVFDPFFTTKGIGRGTGLGLSVSYGIIREHGGWIDIDSAPGRGTRLTVYLPESRPEATAAPRVVAS